MGSGSILLSRGITSVEDAPWDLCYALQHATKILNWQENLMPDEMPPEWMLPFDDELKIWFERVDKEREIRYGGDDSREKPDLDENEYAKALRRN